MTFYDHPISSMARQTCLSNLVLNSIASNNKAGQSLKIMQLLCYVRYHCFTIPSSIGKVAWFSITYFHINQISTSSTQLDTFHRLLGIKRSACKIVLELSLNYSSLPNKRCAPNKSSAVTVEKF